MLSEITGRDRHLMTKALAIAIGAIDRAEQRRQPASDRDGMRILLEALVTNDFELATLTNSVAWIFGGEFKPNGA